MRVLRLGLPESAVVVVIPERDVAVVEKSLSELDARAAILGVMDVGADELTAALAAAQPPFPSKLRSRMRGALGTLTLVLAVVLSGQYACTTPSPQRPPRRREVVMQAAPISRRLPALA